MPRRRPPGPPRRRRIGAEIRGVALSGDLDAATVAAIRQALVRHKVVFFRDQTLDEAGHEAFGRLLGDLVPHPTVPTLDGTAGTLDIDGSRGERASSWHTDVTFVPNYPAISILRAVTLPAYGGDTLWANTEAAYAELPEACATSPTGSGPCTRTSTTTSADG